MNKCRMPNLSGKKSSGFSMIEIVIVLAIIAALAAIGTQVWWDTMEESRSTTMETDLIRLRDASNMFRAEKGRWPGSILELQQFFIAGSGQMGRDQYGLIRDPWDNEYVYKIVRDGLSGRVIFVSVASSNAPGMPTREVVIWESR